MVWGCMSSNELGKLVFVEGNINSLRYQEILDESLNSSIAMLRRDGSPIFQQDLAPAHNSRSTKEWLSAHNIDVLQWPANSPDLSSIKIFGEISVHDVKAIRPTKDKDRTEAISSCPLGNLF